MSARSLIHQYFFFSKRDRIAVIILLLLIALAWYLPYMFAPRAAPSFTADSSWVRVIDKMTTPAGNSPNRYQDKNVLQDFNKNSGDAYNNADGASMFTFNPNELDANGWRRLGLRDRTIETILKYRGKGGKFRTPGDLEKIYGLPPALVEKLMPYVRLPQTERNHFIQGRIHRQPWKANSGDRASDRLQGSSPLPSRQPETASYVQPGTTQPGNYEKRDGWSWSGNGVGRRSYSIVDLNKADTAALVVLPCIGSKLALRIVQFRDKLGGFHSVEQVRETYGITDSSYAVIRPFLRADAADCRLIALNEATVDDLKIHPYIRYDLARTIIAYRQEHGQFSNVADLQRITALLPAAYEKIKPYLRL